MGLKRIGELCPLCDAPLLLDEPANVVFCQNPKCGYTYNLGDDPELGKQIVEEFFSKNAASYYKLLTMDATLRKEFGLDN